jgi:hypothetical protein
MGNYPYGQLSIWAFIHMGIYPYGHLSLEAFTHIPPINNSDQTNLNSEYESETDCPEILQQQETSPRNLR